MEVFFRRISPGSFPGKESFFFRWGVLKLYFLLNLITLLHTCMYIHIHTGMSTWMGV